MPHLRIREVAELLGVSDDTVRRLADKGTLPIVLDPSGRKAVDGRDLAHFLRAQADASEPSEPGVTVARSARNRLRGIVTNVTKDGVMAQVEMRAGGFRLVSLMSREAADDLELDVGSVAVASVKSTHVVVEITEG